MVEQSQKRVLMLVNTHVYDDVRVMNEAQTLTEAGYQVTIIGAARRSGYAPQDTLDGIEIILTPVPLDSRISTVIKTLWQVLRGNINQDNRAPLKHSTLFSLLVFNLWVLRLGIKQGAAVIHCHDFSPYLTAWLLARLKRARLLYDSHESAPNLYAGRKAKVIALLEKQLLRRTDMVITVGERLAAALKDQGAKQVAVIGNGKRAEDYESNPEELKALRSQLDIEPPQLIIAYFGTLDPNRKLQPLLEAIKQSSEVTLLIGGRGLLEHTVQQIANEVPNIHWFGWLRQHKVMQYTMLADVLYSCLEYDANTHRGQHIYYAIPNKMFEAFAAGKALIAVKHVGEMGDIIEQHAAGILLDEVTPESLTAAFNELKDRDTLDRLQHNAKQAGQQYNWPIARTQLIAIYAKLVGEN